jgi:Golgi phosphoprotein 3
MNRTSNLSLHEEILLLSLRNQKGTVATSFSEFALAGAVLADLLLDGRITLDGTKKKLVDLRNSAPTGDPVIDECLAKMASAKRRANLQTWVSRLAGIKKLRHKVARKLCNRGILRADEDKVALIFTRKIYPEMDPRPEREILERMRAALLSGDDRVEPRTAALIALAHGGGVLGEALGKKEVNARKKRIKQIVDGDPVGKATKEAIDACKAAAMVAITASTT